MGKLWRRLTETVHQSSPSFGGSGKGGKLTATPNARNIQMLKEATTTLTQVRTIERDVRAMQVAASAKVTNMSKIMGQPLPRVFAWVGGEATALVEPVGDQEVVGKDVKSDGYDAALATFRTGLYDDVLLPIEKWVGEYSRLVAENKKLEDLRLELDSRRRTSDDLAQTINKLRNDPKPSEGQDKKIEEMVAKKNHKDIKLNAVATTFEKLEDEIHLALEVLLLNARDMRSWLMAASQRSEALFAHIYNSFPAIEGSAPAYIEPAPPISKRTSVHSTVSPPMSSVPAAANGSASGRPSVEDMAKGEEPFHDTQEAPPAYPKVEA